MQHLKTAQEFAAVLDASKRKSAHSGIWRSPHFMLHLAPLPSLPAPSEHEGKPDGSSPRIGVIMPKRWAKRAVTRNTLKRQVYAVSREYEQQLRTHGPQAGIVLRLAAGFSREQFPSASSAALKHAARTELLDLFGKLIATQAPHSAGTPA